MSQKNPSPIRIDPGFREWLQQRQKNIQQMIEVPMKITMMDTQRIIARTYGVNITKEMLRRMKSE